jgi:hypothetical protein
VTEPKWSKELESWAIRAGYTTASDEASAMLYSRGGELRFYARVRTDGWYQLTTASRGGEEQPELAAVSMDVIERHLFDVLGVVIRSESGLPFLMMPWEASQVAPGYQVSSMSEDGYRTLDRDGVGPIAIARDEAESLLTLIPLSHFLRLTVSQLEQSYLTRDGAPLMNGQHYA